jgi:hypothetical protein
MGDEKEHAEIEPVEEMPLAAEDHGLTAGEENEDVAVPDGAGAPAEAMVPPAAESAESLPPIREADDLTPTPTLGSTAPVPGEVLQPDAEMVAKFITDDRLNTLWKRADKVKLEVDEKVHTLDIARALLDQIMYARNYLLAGRHFFEEAERHVNEVEFRVSQNFKSRKWSILYGVPILIYEILIAVGLVLLFFYLGTSAFESFSEDLGGMLAAMIWGGLGGVAGAWLALIKHTSQEQDFDRQHTLWYLNSPFMGALIGAFIYWVMRAGLISLTGGDIKTIDSPYIVYILAWLAGYQHNVFTSIVKRILKILEIGAEDTNNGKAEEKPPAAPKPPTVVIEENDQEGEGSPKPQG